MPNEKFPTALPEGTVLAGQFLIEEVLGQGGFGITYRAKDHKTGDTVAVKEYFPDTMVARTETTVVPYTGEREENFKYGLGCFLREAETLAKYVDNDGIVSIRSYFEENGTAYFVMDFVDGVSFDKYIKDKGGKIDFEDAKNILLPIIDALGAVHKDGIVHRDVTPDNIYITKDGAIKLLDFGAARYSIGDKSRSLDVVLKHGYAPKEQYTRHGKQGPFTDIYTVGVCFYRAITGKLPVDSIDRLEEDDVVLPSTLGVKIEPYEEEAILKAMAVQPADRFQSMEEFKAALLNEPVAEVKEEKLAIAQPEDTVKCPSCGAENKIGTNFCKACGANMTAPTTTVQEFKTVAITPEQEVKPKKKKNVGLIVACIIIFLALVGGGGGLAYYKLVVEPEKLAEEQKKADKDAIKDDEQIAESIQTAIETSLMDPDIVCDPGYTYDWWNGGERCDITKYDSIIKDYIADIFSLSSINDLKDELNYRNATGKIYVSIGKNYGVYVEIECSDDVKITAGDEPTTFLADNTPVTTSTSTTATDPEPDPEPSTTTTTTTTTTSNSYCSLAGLSDTYVNNAAEGSIFNEYSDLSFAALYYPDELQYYNGSAQSTYFSNDVCNINIIDGYVIFIHDQAAYYYDLSTDTTSVMSSLSDYYPMRRIIASDNGMVFIYGDYDDYKMSLLNTDGTVSHYYYSVSSPSAVTVVDDTVYWVSTDGTKIDAVSISDFDNDVDQSYYLYEGNMSTISYLVAGGDYVYFNGTNTSGESVIGRVSIYSKNDTATSVSLPDGYALSGMNYYNNKLYVLLNDWTNYQCQLYTVDVSATDWNENFSCDLLIDTDEGCFWSVGIQTAGTGTMMLAGCNYSGYVSIISYLDGTGMNFYYSEW